MSALFLSRIRLKREAAVASLAQLLVPAEAGEQTAAAHRLVWALFSDGPDRRRDFLWRQDRPGEFLALSDRPPNPLHDIFQIESKPFEPALSVGDRLGFRLHANPVISEPRPRGERGKRQDVVMHALYATPSEKRAEVRLETAITAGRAWLARQGTTHGFSPEGDVAVDGYETCLIPRRGLAPIRHGVMDLEGVLTVTDPDRFLAALPRGFGSAKAFGCGLMLIRRAG